MPVSYTHLDVYKRQVKRTHYLLQQGKYVADVAYFTGEDAPKMTGIRDPKLPEGFNFDYVNAEVIATMSVKNGYFVLPDGMKYRVLVLPPQKIMRPAVLEKLKELIAAGGIAVSYTHLDVYKRQISSMRNKRILRRFRPKPAQPTFGWPTVGDQLPMVLKVMISSIGAARLFLTRMAPVSYTHLDVYKRQG